VELYLILLLLYSLLGQVRESKLQMWKRKGKIGVRWNVCLPPQLPTAEKWTVLNLGVCTRKMALLMQEKASCSSSDGSVGNCCRKHAMWKKRAKIQLPGVTHLSSTMWLQLWHFHCFSNLYRMSQGPLWFHKVPGQQIYCLKNLGRRLGNTNFNFMGKTLLLSSVS